MEPKPALIIVDKDGFIVVFDNGAKTRFGKDGVKDIKEQEHE